MDIYESRWLITLISHFSSVRIFLPSSTSGHRLFGLSFDLCNIQNDDDSRTDQIDSDQSTYIRYRAIMTLVAFESHPIDTFSRPQVPSLFTVFWPSFDSIRNPFVYSSIHSFKHPSVRRPIHSPSKAPPHTRAHVLCQLITDCWASPLSSCIDLLPLEMTFNPSCNVGSDTTRIVFLLVWSVAPARRRATFSALSSCQSSSCLSESNYIGDV